MPSALVDTQPAYLNVPEYDETYGPEVADLAESCGVILDPGQRLVLDAMYAVRPTGQLAAAEVAVICPRQNMKTVTFEAAALGDLFLFDDRLVVWTAHQFKTTQEAFRDLAAIVENYDHMRRRVRAVSTANGEESIELRNGCRLNFLARTAKSGRGLSGDKVFLDEALELIPGMMGALVPTMSARPNGQLRYGSSAGKQASQVLRGVRDRGRTGRSRRLAYIEWCARQQACADENCTHLVGSAGCALDDEELWAEGNPALGVRITSEFIRETERQSMTPVEFARERLGWWDDPPEGGAVFDEDQWQTFADEQSKVPGTPAFAVDVTPDRAWATIGVAGMRADGRLHVAIHEHRRGTRWVVEELTALAKHGPVAVGAGSPAAALLQDIEAAGVPVHLVSMQEYVQACGVFYDRVISGQTRHLADPSLDVAVAGAVQQPAGDAWKWSRKGLIDISPLVAVTIASRLALQGFDYNVLNSVY